LSYHAIYVVRPIAIRKGRTAFIDPVSSFSLPLALTQDLLAA
jgi:hypothetical protein